MCVSHLVISNSLKSHGCCLPGSCVHGILQARILEWVAMPSSRDLPDTGIEPTSLMPPELQVGSLPLEPPRKPLLLIWYNKHILCLIGLNGLPWWFSGKDSACQCRRPRFDPGVRKILWRRKWQPTLVFLPEKSHGQRNLVGYSPWGHKELDMT